MLSLDHFKTIKKHVLLLKQSNLLIFWFSESFHQSSLCRSAQQNKKKLFFHKLTQSERERERGESDWERGRKCERVRDKFLIPSETARSKSSFVAKPTNWKFYFTNSFQHFKTILHSSVSVCLFSVTVCLCVCPATRKFSYHFFRCSS